MKNILCLILALGVFTPWGQAQNMSWVPSKYISDNTCADMTDCSEKIVCYKLKYTPNSTGSLKSYTTGFLLDCDDKVSAIVENSSCSMNDHSDQILACESQGKILLHCSGNTGDLEVTSDEPVYLHQICVQFDNQFSPNIMIVEEPTIGLTTNMDVEGVGPMAENADYTDFKIKNTVEFCTQHISNLNLTGLLDDLGGAKLEWEPAKETKGGIYTLWHQLNGGPFVPVAEYDAIMLEQREEYMYEHKMTLSSEDDHHFKVTYANPQKDELNSNKVNLRLGEFFDLKIAPNPASDITKIHVTSRKSEVEMIIQTVNGQLIQQQIIDTNTDYSLRVNDFAAGIYHISVKDNDEIISKKLIVID